MLTELIKLGLSEKEAKVYLAILELGAQTAQQVARKAGVNRATTYVVLQGLMRKGLAATFTKNKRTYFTASAPEQLDHLLRKQEEDIFERRRDLEKVIPELRAVFSVADDKPKVRFFEGREGVQAMMDEVYRKISKNSIMNEFLALDELHSAFPNYEQLATMVRLTKNITARSIYTHRDGPQEQMQRSGENRRAHFLSADRYPFMASILMIPSQHQVVIASYRRGHSGIIIDNPELTQTLGSLFDVVWDMLQVTN